MKDDIDGKDETIRSFLRALSQRFPDWQLEDHWEGDRCAIGLVGPAAPAHLAYVSSWAQRPGYFYVELEVAGGSPQEYEVVARLEKQSLSAAIAAVVGHLAGGRSLGCSADLKP